MKRYLLPYVLLLALILCSCTSALPETKDPEELDDADAEEVSNAYASVLDDFHLLTEYTGNEESLDSVLEEIGFVEYPRNGELAYAIVDINKDEIPELLLGTTDGLKNSAPNSIFTLKDGKPILLKSFWSRQSGVISPDGTIYCVGSGGAAHTYLSSFSLDENADALTQLTDIYSDYSDSEEKIFYVQLVDGENNYITEDAFWDFFEEYDDPLERMELTIIPIAN